VVDVEVHVSTLSIYELNVADTSAVNSSKSSTYKVLQQDGFDIQYEDQSGAEGDYISDTFEIGGVTIKALEMGLAYKATIGTGLVGIGYSINEASNSAEDISPFTYPSILDTMVSQGLISRKAYSLYLDDLESATGSIIFGGLDADKYHGDLLQMPVAPTQLRNGSQVYAELGVALTSFGITGQQGNTVNLTSASYRGEVVVLDSGTTITYLSESIVAKIYREIGAVDDTEGSGMVYIDCNIKNQSPDLTFNYGFGGAAGLSIKILIDEVVFDLQDLFAESNVTLPSLPFTSPCGFGIWSGGNTGPFILGDTFLRSAYVVYDLESNEIAIAQTNFNSSSSSVVEFQASETGIPKVSVLASSVDVTATATAVIPGIGVGKNTESGSGSGGSATPSVTGLVTTAAVTGTTSVAKATSAAGLTATSAVSSTVSQSKSAGVACVPAFDARGLTVLGLAGVFAVLGGGWFVS
jgi:hypothetical protein